ncbi:DoxX family protein [Streptomyces sp. NPDC060194]|uniref:DoxX family protein n=1 Tax=Streptomyces sp. NPDC060194 TaxID=3347069 RepID=UPI00364D558F
MAVLRKLARPLLASTFVSGGLGTLRTPQPVVPAADPVAQPVAQRVPGLPADTEQLVRINGAVQVGAGLLLATGKLPRVASLALAASLIPTTVAGHAFWNEKDPDERRRQQIHFFKNVSMLGGLLLAAVDTHGKPSVAYRSRHAVSHSGDLAQVARREARLAARSARISGREARVNASRSLSRAGHGARANVRSAARTAKRQLPST